MLCAFCNPPQILWKYQESISAEHVIKFSVIFSMSLLYIVIARIENKRLVMENEFFHH